MRRRLRHGWLVMLGLALAGEAAARDSVCAPAADAARSAEVAAICDHGRRWIRAFAAGDLERLMALYQPDARVALHGQPELIGVAAIRAYFAPALAAQPRVEFLLDVEDIRVQGDVAWLVSRYWYTSDAGGGRPVLQDAGRSVLIYRRSRGDRADGSRGEWKIQLDIDQASPDAPFPPPPTAH